MLTDDEIDTLIGNAILDARIGLGNTCAAHRVIFRAGMREAAMIAEWACPRTPKWGSENADRYHAQDDWLLRATTAIRKAAGEP